MGKIDFIIVGQGLAGSILAWELLNLKYRVIIFDQPDKNISSSVAAGLFNPVTGRRFVKTWKADHLFPALHEFYPMVEKKLNGQFFHKKPIFRPFSNFKEQNEFIAKSNSRELGLYTDQIITGNAGHPFRDTPYGGVFLKNCGYLDISQFLEKIRSYFISLGIYRNENFSEIKLKTHKDHIEYSSIKAHKVIFCNGASGVSSRYFGWLPFRPVKGEILLFRLSEQPDFIFNRQIFILPLNNGTCKAGATYDWRNINTRTTPEAKKYVNNKLLEILSVNHKIIDQQAGIRPATKDRRPFLGRHPEFIRMEIFNGFGSKGVSLIPYFAKKFVNYLLYDNVLDKEVNINRYKYLY